MSERKKNLTKSEEGESKKTGEQANRRHIEPPVWEWIIAGFGLILVVAALSTILYRAITEETKPPILEISFEAPQPVANGYLVKFRVKNTGNQTANDLTIEGLLKRGEESVETSTTRLNYAPANSEREGGLFFTKNPNDFEFRIRALGYEKP